METTVTVERVAEEDEIEEDLPSHEILRENLKKKRRKRVKTVFVEPKCTQCGKVFADKTSLSHHVQIHNTQNPFPCRQCEYKAKTKKYLARHVKRVHGAPPVGNACQYCGKTFHYKSGLTNHERVHTGAKPYKCDVCGKDFSARYSLLTHKLIHTDEKPFKCKFCDYACRDSSTIRKHQQRHLGTLKRYHCDMCPGRYDSKSHLKNHIREAHTEPEVRAFKCTKCSASFKQRAVLKKHMQAVHERTMTCVCPICDVTLSTYHNLKEHMRRHMDERPYKCAVERCGSTFKDRQGLKKHNAIHNMSLHVICDICGKTFSRKHRLASHLTHHQPRVKKEECRLCGDKFYTQQYLTKHMKQKHAKKRQQYICDLCDFATHNKPSIVMHIKYGHSLDKGICKLCGKVYKRNQHLRLHYWNTHGVRFKTNARMNVIPAVPMVQIKEEPPELIPDLEFDLLDIEKEEPFAGFEPSEYPELPMVLRGHEQSLQQFLARVIHDEHAHVNLASDPTSDLLQLDASQLTYLTMDEKTENNSIDTFMKQHEMFKNKYLSNEANQTKIDVAIEIERTTGLDNTMRHKQSFKPIKLSEQEERTVEEMLQEEHLTDVEEEIIHPQKTSVEKVIQEQQSSEFAERIIHPQKTSVEEVVREQYSPEFAQEIIHSHQTSVKEVIQERLSEFAEEIIHPHHTFVEEVIQVDKSSELAGEVIQPQQTTVDTEAQNQDLPFSEDVAHQTSEVIQGQRFSIEVSVQPQTTQGSAEVRSDVGQKRPYMPVEEFIQRMIREPQQKMQEETMDVDQEAEASVHHRLRELLIKMKRTDSGKVGVLKKNGNRVKVLTADEIEEIKNRKPEDSSQSEGDDADDDDDDDDYEPESGDDGEKKKEPPGALKLLWNMHQCYICFKLFESKPKLIDHCKSHFDVCNETTLKKCPLCTYVTTKSDIKKHLKEKHKQDINISFMNIKDRKINSKGSRYYYDTKNEAVKELEIIPSIKILNKKASMELDKKNREMKNKFVGKPKLVRRGSEWIVVKEKLDLSNHVLPDAKDLDKNSDNYLDVIKKMGKEAKRKGVQMLYPCNKCEKVCQNLSALTLHSRRHDPNPKPFKPRGSIRKEKEMKKNMVQKAGVSVENRNAKPKPIVNNHKCDPKLIDFYETNIKGGDIEFWQFLKIYNKMDREKVNSFEDLETRTEFGIHYDDKKANSATNSRKDSDSNIKSRVKDVINNINVTVSHKQAKLKAKRDVEQNLVGNRRYLRTIRLTKVEYNKRIEIKNKLRKQIQEGNCE